MTHENNSLSLTSVSNLDKTIQWNPISIKEHYFKDKKSKQIVNKLVYKSTMTYYTDYFNYLLNKNKKINDVLKKWTYSCTKIHNVSFNKTEIYAFDKEAIFFQKFIGKEAPLSTSSPHQNKKTQNNSDHNIIRLFTEINMNVNDFDIIKNDVNLNLPNNDQKYADVDVINADTLDVAIQLIHLNCKPLVLNMANSYSPGGSYKEGPIAQEECLFVRTNLSFILDGMTLQNSTTLGELEFEDSLVHKDWYPLNKDFIFTPNVQIIRAGSNMGFSFYDKCFHTGVISGAAPDLRASTNPLSKDNIIEISQNIINLLDTCLLYSHKVNKNQPHNALVLGAWGCGVFNNDPKLVATLFYLALTDQLTLNKRNYLLYFDVILFAVLDHEGGTNITTFTDILKPYVPYLDSSGKIDKNQIKKEEQLVNDKRKSSLFKLEELYKVM